MCSESKGTLAHDAPRFRRCLLVLTWRLYILFLFSFFFRLFFPTLLMNAGRRPLHIAVGKGNADIIQWLCETHSAVINCQSGSGESPVYQASVFESRTKHYPTGI